MSLPRVERGLPRLPPNQLLATALAILALTAIPLHGN
jgi:hypothetical protein